MLWGGHAIRLRVEAEVAVPIGFAMRWLASLTARGGVYYPYSDTVAVRGHVQTCWARVMFIGESFGRVGGMGRSYWCCFVARK